MILASTSPYRKKLMQDAGFRVTCLKPNYDERPMPGLDPLECIAHHARKKAQSLAQIYPNEIVIGSDQGLVEGARLLGKPGSIDAAVEQLLSLRGKVAILATSLVVMRKDTLREYQNHAHLAFRKDLSVETIRAYVCADRPIDCAGSFKIEARGSRLFESIQGDDPTAIQGLPMIALNRMLLEFDPEFDTQFD